MAAALPPQEELIHSYERPLHGLKTSALRRQAMALGISEAALDAADDSADPRQELIDLIVLVHVQDDPFGLAAPPGAAAAGSAESFEEWQDSNWVKAAGTADGGRGGDHLGAPVRAKSLPPEERLLLRCSALTLWGVDSAGVAATSGGGR